MGAGPQRTPLFNLQEAAGARIIDFFGWEMGVSFEGILDEHRRVREDLGLFDVSHMGQVRVTGPGAPAFLDHLLTNRASDTPVGKGVYSPMCQPDGGTIDDLIAYRVAEDGYLVVVNAANREKDVEWMRGQAAAFDVRIADESDDWAMVALQGPKAVDLLDLHLAPDGDTPSERFGIREAQHGGTRLLVCRTGYTGEDGFEILIPAPAAEAFFQGLLASSGRERVWCGLGARDSLRLEAGFPLYGHELAPDISPLAARLGWAVKFSKPAFTGREALLREKEAGPTRVIRHFVVLDRRIAREGAAVVVEGREVGTVRSGAMSPVLAAPVGSALVEATVDPAEPAAVDIRGKSYPLQWTKPPLHRNFIHPDHA